MKKTCEFYILLSTFSRNHLKALPLAMSLLLPLTFSQIALSADGNHETNKVPAKCHVSLIDGNEVISFWSVQQKKLSKLKDSIVGKKAYSPQSNSRIKIYKTFECVLDDDDFKSRKARLLDSKTPR